MNAIRKRILARHLRDAMGEIDALEANLQTAVDALEHISNEPSMPRDLIREYDHIRRIAQKALEQIRGHDANKNRRENGKENR